MEYGGGSFGLENSAGGLSLVYEKDGMRKEVLLSLPPAEILGSITTIYYGAAWSVALTHNQDTGERYVIITLGAADVAAGRQTLPGNELLNADCVLLPAPPLSVSFAEDKLFLFYRDGIVRVLDGEGRMQRLTVEGASENSVAVKYRGLYFIMQPNGTPIIILGNRNGAWESEAFDYGFSQLRSLRGHSASPSGLCVRFLDSLGQEVEMQVTVREEGNLEAVDVKVR